MKKKENLNEMSYNELVAKNVEVQKSIKVLMAKSVEYQKAINLKKEESIKEALRACMKTYGVTKEEMKSILDGEESINPVIPQKVYDLTETEAIPEEKEDNKVETPALPEPREENKVETKTTSVFDLPALQEEYNPLKTKKRKTPAALEKTLVEKAVELAKTLPVADGIDVKEPYFVNYEFAVSKKGKLTLDADTFGRNESVEKLKAIRAEKKGFAKTLHATDVISTEDCIAYMWYDGKYITVDFYSIPVKDAIPAEPEKILPTMESLLCDDPEYKAFYHPVTPEKKNNRRLPTLDELLSEEPVNKILCLGNEEPKGKAYRQHTRINHVRGIIPTETATGKTTIYIPAA